MQPILFSGCIFAANYIKKVLGGTGVDLVAIGAIAFAVDILAIRFLLKGTGLIKIKKISSQNQPAEQEPKFGNDTLDEIDGKIIKPEESYYQPHPGGTDSGKTVLLCNVKKGVPYLRSLDAPGEADLVLDRHEMLAGRLIDEVDLVCKNNAVGKVHAKLVYKSGEWYVMDLNSVNGTFVNSQRIKSNEEYCLKKGDNLAFANCEYLVFV